MDNKVLILDYSKWRCGGNLDNPNRLGRGTTQMKNHEGYSCCLGQFACQINPKTEGLLLGRYYPRDINFEISDLNYPTTTTITDFCDYQYKNTLLANDAMDINDSRHTTPRTKIKELKALFAKHGYTIEVINEPK